MYINGAHKFGAGAKSAEHIPDANEPGMTKGYPNASLVCSPFFSGQILFVTLVAKRKDQPRLTLERSCT